MNDITIRVTTEQLAIAAETAEQAIGRVSNDFSDILGCVNASSRYWEGRGNDAHVRKMRTEMEKVEQMLNRFKEDVADLRKIAGIYEQTHRETVEYTNQLSADVII